MSSIPLAARLRPATLGEFAGQAHLVGPGMVLRRLVEQKTLHSLVLWGPPGCGKTTLIRLLASETGIPLVEFSAVTSGIAEVRAVIAEAKKRLQADGSRTAVFIDELHRFNKAQQDAFLPHVEQGTIILLGATTENPYFSINAALRSRLKIYQLQGLTDADLSGILDRALVILATQHQKTNHPVTPHAPSPPAPLPTKVGRGESEEAGNGSALPILGAHPQATNHLATSHVPSPPAPLPTKVGRGESEEEKSELLLSQPRVAAGEGTSGNVTPLTLSPDARALLIGLSGGDARFVLGALEVAMTLAADTTEITLELIEQVLQQRQLLYDKTGDQHYDTISAFIKSIRGSDVDAALHYLARMLEAGEDPAFIARRLVISASEDIGLANAMGLVIATAARQAVETIGMPEAHYPLAHATVYLAASPKSNTAGAALSKARKAVQEGPVPPIPLHLRNAPVPQMGTEHGMGVGYQYPHDSPSGWLPQEYLPEGVRGVPYYRPKGIGEERDIAAWLKHLKSPPAKPGAS